MKKILTTLLLGSALCVSSFAYANHLGPVVLGTERTEEVFYCTDLEAAKILIKTEEESIKNNEPVGYWLQNEEVVSTVRNFCAINEISYVSQKVIYEWMSHSLYPDGSIQMEVFHLIESSWKETTVYVFTPDPVAD